MSIGIANPWVLLLLVLLPAIVLLSYRSLAGLGKGRRVAALVIRIAILALLIFTLAETQYLLEDRDLAVIFLLDESESVVQPLRDRALQFVNHAAEEMGPRDYAGLIVFGREARFETAIERSLDVPRIESEISRAYTDIGAAIRLAVAGSPEGAQKRIVLLTDGNENQGRAEKAARAAASLGIPIDVVPIRYEHESEVLLEKLIVPEEVRQGEAFEVKILVEAYQDGPARVRLFENQSLVSSEEAYLKKGKNVFTVKRIISKKGFYTYRAVVESGQDSLYQNNDGYGYTMVAGESMVLYLERQAGDNPFLPEALLEEGLRVDVRGVDRMPIGLGEFQPYDLIIIDNIPAGDLTERQMLTIESAVKDLGLGLIMVGGQHSFGAGGYQGSPIERALPVFMELKQRKVMPNGALVLIMHTCEFQNGNMWARQIAKKAIRTLSAHDYAGLLLYDFQGGEKWLFRPRPVGDKTRMLGLIGRMNPGDMPTFDQTLVMARKGLQGVQAALKHIVIISDGDPTPPNLRMITQMAVEDKITISTVMIGGHMTGPATMKELARRGKGRFYNVQDPNELPQIFVKEASIVRKSVIFEKTFRPRIAQATEVVRGLEEDILPELHGYVATTPKDLAQVPIIAVIDKQKDPILAHWRYGLGKGVAFTSDAKNIWGATWMSWENRSKFWGQVARWTSRTVGRGDFQASTRLDGNKGHLTIDAVDADGRFVNFLRFQGRVSPPTLEGEDLVVTQTAPGRYEATFRTDEVGTYFVNLTYEDADGNEGFYTTGIPVSYSPEYLRLRTNEPLIHSIREISGGRMLSLAEPRGVFSRRGLSSSRSSQDIWPALLLAAILLFPADVFVRRVWIPYDKIWRFLVATYGRVLRRRRRIEITSPVERLLRAKPKLKGEGLPLKRFRAPAEAPKAEVRPPGAGAPPRKKKGAPRDPKEKEAPKPAEGGPASSYTGRLLDAKKRAFKRKEGQDRT